MFRVVANIYSTLLHAKYYFGIQRHNRGAPRVKVTITASRNKTTAIRAPRCPATHAALS
jgi:hypothetical protein